jgi:6-pyruvoyltetrahydropterin/6-carboxytetrahydropterin synthase
MKIRIGKEFIWQMSHRLPFHKGGCRNIHGHSYMMRVEVEGETDSKGMIMDYYDIETILAPLIEKMDHSFCVDSNDTVMLDFLKKQNFKYYLVPFTTTAENLTKHITEIIRSEFKKSDNLKTMKIRVNETADVFAELETDL